MFEEIYWMSKGLLIMPNVFEFSVDDEWNMRLQILFLKPTNPKILKKSAKKVHSWAPFNHSMLHTMFQFKFHARVSNNKISYPCTKSKKLIWFKNGWSWLGFSIWSEIRSIHNFDGLNLQATCSFITESRNFFQHDCLG